MTKFMNLSDLAAVNSLAADFTKAQTIISDFGDDPKSQAVLTIRTSSGSIDVEMSIVEAHAKLKSHMANVRDRLYALQVNPGAIGEPLWLQVDKFRRSFWAGRPIEEQRTRRPTHVSLDVLVELLSEWPHHISDEAKGFLEHWGITQAVFKAYAMSDTVFHDYIKEYVADGIG